MIDCCLPNTLDYGVDFVKKLGCCGSGNVLSAIKNKTVSKTVVIKPWKSIIVSVKHKIYGTVINVTKTFVKKN